MFSAVKHQSETPRTINMRRVWIKAHRWVALGVGWLLALVALVGAILVVAQPLDRLSHPQFFKAAQGTAVSAADAPTMQSIRDQLIAVFGSKAN